MVRSKIKYEFIADERTRRETFNKRKSGIFKKLDELKTLCDVEICSVIVNGDGAQPEVWPSPDEAFPTIEKFVTLPPSASSHSNSRVDQVGFLRQNLARISKNVDKEIQKVQTLEKEVVLAKCVAREEPISSNSLELQDMLRLLEEKIEMVDSLIAGVGTSSTGFDMIAEETNMIDLNSEEPNRVDMNAEVPNMMDPRWKGKQVL